MADSPHSFQELRDMLKSDDLDIRVQAMEAFPSLSQFSETQVTDWLLDALNDDRSDVILFAIKLLGDRQDERIKDRLLAKLKLPSQSNTWGLNIKCRIVGLLGDLVPDTAIVEALIEALGDEDYEVGSSAAEVLKNIPRSEFPYSRIIGLFENENYNTKSHALGLIENIGGQEAIPDLIRAASNDAYPIREAAAWALGRLGAVKSLIDALSSSDWEIRYAGVFALGKIGDRRAVQPLMKAIFDPNNEVGCAAIESLEWIGDTAAVPTITDLLKQDYPKDPREAALMGNLRYLACKILAKLGTPADLPFVRWVIENDKGHTQSGVPVQWTAAYALDEIEKREKQGKTGAP